MDKQKIKERMDELSILYQGISFENIPPSVCDELTRLQEYLKYSKD